jgi:putative nucleotidyltransferase with HDIG domain
MTTTEGEVKPTIAEILSALSHALDLTEGQPRGHAVRTSLLASRIAGEMRLDETATESLYYASLLKDAGSSCTTVSDGTTGRRLSGRLRRLLGLQHEAHSYETPSVDRCIQGSEIAIRLGFGPTTANAILHMDEHWDGSGGPEAIHGDAIPLESRILSLAQTLELAATEVGQGPAYQMIEARSGKWFDPAVVDVARALQRDEALWQRHAAMSGDPSAVLEPPPGAGGHVAADLDEVCEAFAKIIDSKSGYTGQHSTRVMRVAVEAGRKLDVEDLDTLRRAALLHDVGKLGVSIAILDKNGPLTEPEVRAVRQHPKHSYEILSRIRGFGRISQIAGAHHERLDGSGYWRGLSEDQLDLEMRLLATSDVFDALTADRPYRGPMPLNEAYGIMKQDPGLDQACVEAVWYAAAENRSLCGSPV